jgi:hypothetical protein
MSEKVVIGNAELWHGDCREVLPSTAPLCCVISDPPYEIQQKAGTSTLYGRRVMQFAFDRPGVTDDVVIRKSNAFIYVFSLLSPAAEAQSHMPTLAVESRPSLPQIH